MESLCAFNISTQGFISLGVTIAATPFARLRGLLGKMRMRSDEAMWVVPSRGIHTVGLRFPIDVLYLDRQLRVIYAIENLAPLRIPRIIWTCASILQLPARSIYDSGTQVGHQLLIGSADDLTRYWDSRRASPAAEDMKQFAVAPKPASSAASSTRAPEQSGCDSSEA